MFTHRSPIEQFPFYMLIETSGSLAEHDEEKLNKFLSYSMDEGNVIDGTVTNDSAKMAVRQ